MRGPSARLGRRCVRGRGRGTRPGRGPRPSRSSRVFPAGPRSPARSSASLKVSSLRGPALGVLSEQHEVAGVGDEHEAVPAPVAAHLIAVRGQPSVVAGGLDLDHAALGKLSLSRSALLHLAGGVESEVGVARAVVGELGDAGHLGPERGADGVEQVAERRVVGALAGGAAGCPDGTEVGRGIAWTAAVSLAAGGGIGTMSPKGAGNARRGRPRRRCVGGASGGRGGSPLNLAFSREGRRDGSAGSGPTGHLPPHPIPAPGFRPARERRVWPPAHMGSGRVSGRGRAGLKPAPTALRWGAMGCLLS